MSVNFNNKRTRKTIRRALGMTLGMLQEDKPRWLSTRFIDRYYGQQQSETSKWLRKTLLIKHGNWSMADKKCQKYTVNPEGVRTVKRLLEIPVVIGTRQEKLVDRKLAVEWCKSAEDMPFDINNIEYTDKSNRYWNPIQNMPKGVRNSFLKTNGLRVQYDIRSAAPSLLHQLSWQYSHGHVLESIDYYTENKSLVRQKLSKETGLPVDNIKVLINSLFAGGKLSTNPRTSCYETCNKDLSVIRYLQQHPWILALKADIKQMWEYLKPLLPTHTITMKNGKTRRLQMTSKNKWHLYFSIERSVISEIRSYLELVGVKYFLIHDAFVCQSLPYSIDDLSAWIKAGTDFDVCFDKLHLSYYDD